MFWTSKISTEINDDYLDSQQPSVNLVVTKAFALTHYFISSQEAVSKYNLSGERQSNSLLHRTFTEQLTIPTPFTIKVAKLWSERLRETVEPPPLEILKTQWDKALSRLI